MENKELSKAIAIMKQMQNKHIRLCIWLDSSSIFKRDIYQWFENKNIAISEIIDILGEVRQPELFGIPIFEISDNEPPKGFDTESYDIIFLFIEDNVNKISVSEVKKFLELSNNQE